MTRYLSEGERGRPTTLMTGSCCTIPVVFQFVDPLAVFRPTPTALVPARRAPALAQQKSYSALRARPHVYSGHNCVGILDTVDSAEAVRCRFRNVCLTLNEEVGDADEATSPPVWDVRSSSVNMRYYRPLSALDPRTPLYWYESFNNAWSWVRIDRQSRLTPELIYEPIPADAWWSPAETTVLVGAFWPENFAHALGDDFFPSESLSAD